MDDHKIKQRVINVCRNIKRYRIEKGHSQALLAGKLHIGLSTLRKIERCETDLTVEKLISIADALDMSVLDLLK